MNYKLFLLVFLILMFPLVFAQTQIYGGETRTIGSYDSTSLEESCAQVFVIVNASKPIEFDSKGIREYNLKNCEYHVGGSLVENNKYFDMWICSCSDGGFDLVLSVLPNTINTYAFSLAFYNEDLIEIKNEENENGLVGQTFTTATSLGSKGSESCTTQWECTGWSECIDDFQTRTCSYPLGFCEPTKSKPIEIQTCFSEIRFEEFEEEITIGEVPQGFFARITGATIGTLGTGGTLLTSTFVLLIILLSIMVVLNARNEK